MNNNTNNHHVLSSYLSFCQDEYTNTTKHILDEIWQQDGAQVKNYYPVNIQLSRLISSESLPWIRMKWQMEEIVLFLYVASYLNPCKTLGKV